MSLRPTSYALWATGISGYVVEPTATDKALGFVPTGIARASYANWLWSTAGAWHQYLDYSRGALIFGDGSDGVATLSGATNYARDMYYASLAVGPTAVLNTSNFKLHVNDTLTNNGRIHCDGPAATGNVGATAIAPGSLAGGGNGGNGGAAPASAGSAGGSPYDAFGGRGGTGGTGAGAAPGSGGVPSSLPAIYGGIHGLPVGVLGCAIGPSGVRGLRGGAGGGGGGPAGGGDGGGGGAGGGIVVIAARNVVNSGTISARGGTGATGTINQSGGGGGGGGGAIWITAASYTGATGISALSVAGGMAGAAGGAAGGMGLTGSTGTIVLLLGPV